MQNLSNEKLQARFLQLKIEIESIQQSINKIKEETENSEEKARLIEELYNSYIKALEEYRAIESILVSRGAKDSLDSIKAQYADIKALLEDESLQEVSKEVLNAKSCWTSCKDCITSCTECVTSCTECVTSCTECVTSACVQCVINGSGNSCGASTLVSAPCRPKPDVAYQLKTETIEKMKIQWENKQ